jgi:hypothetical protein
LARITDKQENVMRRLGIALIATIGVAFATPVLAQGLYFGAGPGGIGIGVSPGYSDGYYNDGYAPAYGYRGSGYDGYAPAYGYRGSGYRNYEGSYASSPRYQRCRTVMMQTRDGQLRRVRRCS